MFDKEREMVELGPHSYNLRAGGYGFDSEQAIKCRRIVDQILEERWGPGWRTVLSSTGAKKGAKRVVELKHGIHDPKNKNLGTEASKSISARVKRSETFKRINHSQGSNNSQYGTMWITNGTANRKIKKEDVIPEGWRRGRVIIAGCDGHRLVS